MPTRASWAVGQTGDRQVDTTDARLGVGALSAAGTGPINTRNALRLAPGSPGLVQATGTPGINVTANAFQAVIGASRGLGTYLATLDATLTVAILDVPADPSNVRHDLIVAQQSDADFGDANNGFWVGRVRGTAAASPVDPAVTIATGAPTNSPDYIVLARVRVAAGALAITGAMIDDLRPGWMVAAGAVLPVPSQAVRDALTGFDGMVIYRQDRKWFEIHDGTAWRVQGTAVCTSTADRDSAITNPYSGQLAQIVNNGDPLYQYDGATSAWVQIAIASIYCHVYQANGATQSIANTTPTALTFTAPEIADTHGFHSTSVNPSRITPTIPGRYRCTGMAAVAPTASGPFTVQFRKNGAVVLGSAAYGTEHAVNQAFAANTAETEATISCNGSTDYIELFVNFNFTATPTATFSNTTDQHSWMLVEYLGPI